MDGEEDIKAEFEPQPEYGWFLSLLFDTHTPIPLYVIRTGLISLVPAVLISFLLSSIGIMNEESLPEFEGPVVLMVIGMILLSPLIETFIMVPVLKILSFISKRRIPLAIMSACTWAVFHSLAAPAWGLGIIWPFFVFSCCFLAWRQRSFWHAILVTACIHAFQNSIPALLWAFSQ